MNFKSFGVKILSVCLFALLLQGCRKDSIEEHDILDKQQKEVGFRSGTFPVDLEADVRLWWENHRSTDMWDTVNPNILTLDPVWEFGYETWIGALPVFLVPVSNDLDEEIPDSRYNLIFFEADDEIDVRLLVFQSEESVSGDWDLSTFTGCVFNIDQSTQVQGLHFFQEGYFIDFTIILQDTILQDTLLGIDWPSWLDFDIIRCPTWGNNSKWWREFKHDLNVLFDFDWGGGGGGSAAGSWNGGYWSFWGPGNGPADFGPGFLGGGGGIGGNSSAPSPNHIPLSSNLLFSNEILNEGFKKLKFCTLDIDQKQDNTSLGGFIAQADYIKAYFDPYFSSGVDIYIQESGAQNLVEILQQPNHKWNSLPGYYTYTDLIMPWARHTSAMIISKKVSDLYKYCIQHPNAQQPQIGNPSYSSDLCECMDQYSLDDANLDYTVSYLWTPEPFVTPNFATNVATSWPLIHGLGIRYDVDAIQDFYFTNCQLLLSHATFQECAIDRFFNNFNLEVEFGYTLDEIQYIKDNFDLQSHEIKIKKIDWAQSNANQRANHLVKNLRFIKYYYNCIWTNSQNLNKYFSIDDFFDNFNSPLDYSVTVSVTTKDNNVFHNVGLALSLQWNDPFFTWANTHFENGDTQKTHFTWIRRNGLNQWGNSVITFIVPYSQDDEFIQYLNRPCE